MNSTEIIIIPYNCYMLYPVNYIKFLACSIILFTVDLLKDQDGKIDLPGNDLGNSRRAYTEVYTMDGEIRPLTGIRFGYLRCTLYRVGRSRFDSQSDRYFSILNLFIVSLTDLC